MTTRLFFAAALALSLAGCATYSNDYRDSYADGSYYSPADGDNGDYYYAPERSDPYYADSYYGSGYYDYRYYLGPIGYGSYDGYCSVRYSTCAPYWYGGYSPSYSRSRFGFSLIFGSYGGYGGYGHGYYRPPYYGYGYHSQPIYRGGGSGSRPGRPGTAPPQQPMNWTSYPVRTGRPGANEGRVSRDPSDPGASPPGNTNRPVRIQPRPLYPEPAPNGATARRPMPEPGFRSYREPTPAPMQRPMPAPRPAYREDRPEPRVYRQPERPAQEFRRPEPAPMPMRPAREERSSPPPSSGQGEAPARSGRRRNAEDSGGG